MTEPTLDVIFMDEADQRIELYLEPAGDTLGAGSTEIPGDPR